MRSKQENGQFSSERIHQVRAGLTGQHPSGFLWAHRAEVGDGRVGMLSSQYEIRTVVNCWTE